VASEAPCDETKKMTMMDSTHRHRNLGISSFGKKKTTTMTSSAHCLCGLGNTLDEKKKTKMTKSQVLHHHDLQLYNFGEKKNHNNKLNSSSSSWLWKHT
jgi:hypothetical protein